MFSRGRSTIRSVYQYYASVAGERSETVSSFIKGRLPVTVFEIPIRIFCFLFNADLRDINIMRHF
jgi:hypothetical protein